jgi:hypothetical protein
MIELNNIREGLEEDYPAPAEIQDALFELAMEFSGGDPEDTKDYYSEIHSKIIQPLEEHFNKQISGA